ncbi:MAG: hypothetical protein E6J26_04900 [Chloroflexi bacterium]|nr:MAG: hypothetical protein E6J26_04900 [Chloroflexota bacterium]
MFRASTLLGLRLILLLALLTLPYAPLAQPVAAAPSFVGFVVNSAADSNIADSVLTLREAIGVANGTLTAGFTAQEQAQLGGCTFDGGGNITGGCGAGTPEEIRFDANYTITLGSPLPDLSDNGTVIRTAFGYGSNVQINANHVAGNAFKITGDDVTLDGLRMYGAGTGFSNVWITGSAKRIVIANNYIGDDDGNSPCNDTNAYGGIYVDAAGPLVGGDAHAWIYGNFIDCHSGSPGDGITLVGTDKVVIGADALGNATNAQVNVMGSNQAGIVIRSGAHDNVVRNTIISSSARQGVLIRGSGTNFNVLKESLISNNNVGVQIDGGAFANRIGSPFGGPVVSGNTIVANVADGVVVSGTTTSANDVFGNHIGVTGASVAAGNGANGVLITAGAHDNLVGLSVTERNVIGANSGDGVQIVNGAHDNAVAGNDIGVAGGPRPNLSGVAIYAGAYNNLVGGSISSNNAIRTNNGYGVYIADSATTTNTVTFNYIGYNALDGIVLQNGTRTNRMENNEVSYNQLSGIYLASGAASNFIGFNQIDHNQKYGVILDGLGTSFNLITRTLIFNNTLDGIGERNNAGLNVWEQVRIQDNGGLGIDKNAASEATNTVDGPFPVIRSVDATTGIVTGTASSNAFVELYRVAPDPSGYGEGMSFVASTVSNGAGNWTINLGAGNGGCFTAFQTIGFIVYTSSEFGPNTCRTFLPLVER